MQVRINCDSTHVFEAALLEILTDSVGQSVANRDRPFIMILIENRFTPGVSPDVITEAPELLPHLLVAPGVIDNSLNLAR